MSDQDLHKLLGGYATNTLTETERQALFEAALHDQQLFNALANEQALKELLEDPLARARIVAALDTPVNQGAKRPWTTILEWIRRPTNLGLAGSLATALLAIIAINYFSEEAKFPTSKQVLTEDRSSEVKSHSDSPSSRLEAEPRLNDQGSRLEGKKQSTSVPSVPSIVTPPTPSPPQTPSTEQISSKGKRDVVKEKKRKAVSRSLESFPSKPKRAQGKNTKDASKKLQKDQKVQKEMETLEEGMSSPPLPSASSPPLEEPSSSRPSLDKSSGIGMAETDLDRLEPQRERFQDARTDRERTLSKALGEKLRQGKARDLFYGKKGSEAETAESAPMIGALSSAQTQSLGLRYTVLKRDPQGEFKEVDPAGPFSVADELRLTIEVNQQGYIYVAQEETSGTWKILHPFHYKEKSPHQIGTVEPYKALTLPQEGTLSVVAGKESSQVMILFSKTQRQEFKNLQKEALQKSFKAILSQAKERTGTQQQIFENISTTQGEQATYIVNLPPQRTTEFVAEIPLPIKNSSP